MARGSCRYWNSYQRGGGENGPGRVVDDLRWMATGTSWQNGADVARLLGISRGGVVWAAERGEGIIDRDADARTLLEIING